jgi:hypothetical protein
MAMDGRRSILSLAEVRESGRPAYFYEYGEALLYRRDQLFDLRDWRGFLRTGAPPSPLPATVLEQSVGIEYGWRHADACDCRLCRPPAAVSLVRAPVRADRQPTQDSTLLHGEAPFVAASGS